MFKHITLLYLIILCGCSGKIAPIQNITMIDSNVPTVKVNVVGDSLESAQRLYNRFKVEEALKALNNIFENCPKTSEAQMFRIMKLYLQTLRVSLRTFNFELVNRCLLKNDVSIDIRSFMQIFDKDKQVNIEKEYLVSKRLTHNSYYEKSSLITNYPVFSTKIDGYEVATIVDTGAERTNVSSDLIYTLGNLKSEDQIPIDGISTGRAVVNEYQVSGIQISENTTVDLTAIETKLFNFPIIILGQDVIRHFRQVSFFDDYLILYDKNDNYVYEQEVDMYFLNGALCIKVMHRGLEYYAQLDTGFDGHVILNSNFKKATEENTDRQGTKTNSHSELKLTIGSTEYVTSHNSRISQASKVSLHSLYLGSAFLYSHFSAYSFDFENMKFRFKVRK